MGKVNMKVLDANWEILQKRYSGIAESIQKEEKCKIEIESVETKEEAHALVVNKEGEKVRLNSAYRPLQEATRWAEQYEFQNIDINVLMFGLGNGIFVRELLNRLSEGRHLFIVEPCKELFSFVLEKEDISDILEDKRLHLYVGSEYEEDMKDEAGDVVNWDNLSTQIRCEHPGYQKLFHEEYHHFWDVVDRINNVVVTKANTNAYFAYQAVDNVLYNLSFVKSSNYITELIGEISEDIPAVIVSAGPSLDKNVEELKRMKGRAFIIATDTAVRVLEDRGLPYDCIVTVDPAKPAWYLKDYSGCYDKPLFLCAEAQKEITEFHTGRKIWLPDSVYLSSIYEKYGYYSPTYKSGGSVATSAFSVAEMLGLKNIVLIGQDLAFMGESTHAGGHEDHIMNEEEGICMIDGVYGEQVRSRRDWVYYLQWFEEMIQAHPELNVIDATEGGALIHGSKVMRLSEVIEEYCKEEFSFADFMESLPGTFEVNDYEPIEKEIIGLEKGFRNIIYKAKEGLKVTDEFIQKAYSLSDKRHDRLIKEIRKANNYIWRQPGYELVDTYSADMAVGELKDINCITGDPVQDEINSVKSAKLLYEGFIEAAEQLQKLLVKDEG